VKSLLCGFSMNYNRNFYCSKGNENVKYYIPDTWVASECNLFIRENVVLTVKLIFLLASIIGKQFIRNNLSYLTNLKVGNG